MQPLELLDRVRRVLAEVAIDEHLEADLDEQALKVPHRVSSVALAKSGVGLGHSSLARPDALGLAKVIPPVVQSVQAAVDRPRDRLQIVAVGVPVDAAAPPVGNARQQRPGKLLQGFRLRLEVGRCGVQFLDVLSRFAVVGPAGRLNQATAAVSLAVAFYRVSEVLPCPLLFARGEFARCAKMCALMGQLRHEVAQTQRRVDSALFDEPLVFDYSANDFLRRIVRDIANIGFGDRYPHRHPPLRATTILAQVGPLRMGITICSGSPPKQKKAGVSAGPDRSVRVSA